MRVHASGPLNCASFGRASLWLAMSSDRVAASRLPRGVWIRASWILAKMRPLPRLIGSVASAICSASSHRPSEIIPSTAFISTNEP
jgi:hypothetical protein